MTWPVVDGDPAPRLSDRGKIVRTVAISVIAIGVIVVAIAAYVYSKAIGTFEIRRVSLPTRIFTDLTPLQHGTLLDPDSLVDKLQRLGYTEVNALSQPGDYVDHNDHFEIYLRAFRYPSGDHAAMPIHLRFGKAGVDSVTGPTTAEEVTAAALEPELLTSILSDQLENRQPVTLNQVPQHLVDAVISTEDVRFFDHAGIDPMGILRAGFRDLRHGGVREGGSTLTQQLVKNYYLTNERTFKRKVIEAFMSVILDARYSKKEILEAYLNDIYLGRNRSISIVGIGEASHFYFGKPVGETSIAEDALLAGMIRGPNNYSPFTQSQRAMERRNTVLGLMLKYRKITQQEYQQALATPLPRKPYRERGGLSSIPFYVDRALDEMANDYGIKDVKGRGLSIYTAIDLAWQNDAAQRLEQGLEGIERSNPNLRKPGSPLQGVVIGVDVPTGEIRALVGGRNYDTSQFNRALSAKRQVGSLFKPFVYLAAFEPGLSHINITPATLVNDSRFVLDQKFGKDWSPRNYNDEYFGIVTVRKALEESMNAASVRIGMSVGLDAIVKAAHTLGIDADLDEVPSMILGSVAIPPIEMASAYTTIARIGARVPLRTIRFVLDDRGNMLANGGDIKPVQVYPARDVYLGVDVMKGVIDRGTAAGARSLGFTKIAAGKTGTTNDLRDAWFIGFTPQTLALTWVGFDDNSPVGLSGGQAAVPIWTRFMSDVTEGAPNSDFAVPPGIVFVSMDTMSGGLAIPACPPAQVERQAFKVGTEPTAPCPIHSAQPLPLVPPPGTPDLTTTDATAFPETTATTATEEPPSSDTSTTETSEESPP